MDERKQPIMAGEGERDAAGKWEGWLRRAGCVVVARVRVEGWFGPEGVFRWARISLGKRRGCGGAEFVLRWERKEGGEGGEVVERALVVTGASVEEVAEAVAGVSGATCREVAVAREGRSEGGGWLEEVFGARPGGEEDGAWALAEAGHVEPPRASVFGRHDRYEPIRERSAVRSEK